MTTAAPVNVEQRPYAEEDIGNIVAMEHVNVQVPDQATAMLFYLVGLGFTRDPHMMVGLENMWVNIGEQQFHLPTREPQVLRGTIGIVTPDLAALEGRLASLAPRLEGTAFAYSRDGDVLNVTCPWGNQLRCHEASAAWGGILVGVPYVEFTVPTGTAAGIASFYQQALGAPATVEERDGDPTAVVEVGTYQQLRFRESASVPEYDGHHIAIYVADFSGSFGYLAERGLVTEAPRNHQYRFKDIVDPASGEKLFTIEHEVRGLRHPLYRRPLVNRTVGQFQEPRRVNGRTELGTVM